MIKAKLNKTRNKFITIKTNRTFHKDYTQSAIRQSAKYIIVVRFNAKHKIWMEQ